MYKQLSLFVFLLALMVLFFASTAHCTTGKARPNSLGIPEWTTNPNTYLYGAIIGAQVVQIDKQVGISLRVTPAHTFALYSENLLLCGGNETLDKFPESLGGPLVITYKTLASRLVGGIPCHELQSVDRVVSK